MTNHMTTTYSPHDAKDAPSSVASSLDDAVSMDAPAANSTAGSLSDSAACSADAPATNSATNISRRGFLKTTGALAALGALGASTGLLASCTTASKATDAHETHPEEVEYDRIVWGHCSVNCYGRCALRYFVKDGQIVRVDTDNTGDDTFGEHQLRACLRGRSIRQWINHPDRLNYPLRRLGPRGSGEFERISWDEALDDIASEYKRVLKDYGPEAVMIAPASGVLAQNIRDFLTRFVNINGGSLTQSGGYSAAQTKDALPYLYGERAGNYPDDLIHSRLVVLFGDNFAENRISGAGNAWHMINALERGGARVVVIDPRFSPSAAKHADEWIPIRPGTDAALVDAMAYVMITENLIDQEFLDTYTIGYDEDTLPSSAPQNASYKSYILDKGPDNTPKTPAWGAQITGIDADTITRLAREVATTKPCAVIQGLGPQRQANGEQTTRAICMLEILTGNVGVKGGGTGSICGAFTLPGIKVPTEKNPVKAKIPTYMWPQAVLRGDQLTSKNAHVQGVDKLNQSVKLIFNHAGNSLTNQHGYINELHEILADESLCEFIVTWETMMTDSAKYSDIVLPDLMTAEQPNFISGEYCGDMGYLIMGERATNPAFERKSLYESLVLLSQRMGCEEAFSKYRTEDEWLKYLYNKSRDNDPDLPTYDELHEQGVYRRQDGSKSIAFKSFITDPEMHPLKTPSGKIEIYSESLAQIAQGWELGEGDVIAPLPVYANCVKSWDSPDRWKYPLQMIGYHERGHVHSSYAPVEMLSAGNRHALWINTSDAADRGISDGDTLRVFNEFGEIEVAAYVTPRIMPGVCALGEGTWFSENEEGIDTGSCINTLAMNHPSPLAKATPAHTNLVQVRRA